MRLLMLVPYYAPDLGPAAPIFTMLGEELARRGHQVTVIAAVPHYPSGSVPEPYRKAWIQRSTEHGVAVIRVRIPSIKRASMAQRMLQYLSYQLGAAWAGAGERYDAVFVANPALWVWLPFVFLVALRRKPAVFSIHDVYPDVGVKLGIFHHPLVIKTVAALERYCLDRALFVRILSESFRPAMHRLGVPDEKISLIYDWVDTDLIYPLPKVNEFSVEHQLDSKFVVLYAGNIGLSQGLDCVLAAAGQLRGQGDIQFVLVGEGAALDQLITLAERQDLKNLQFIPFQPRERLSHVLASADISLVVLKEGIGAGSLPSKTYSIFASGRPILASVDEGCETWELVKRAGAGLCVPPEDPGRLVEAVIQLKESPALCQQLGENGRRWAEQNHSPDSAAEKFENLFLNGAAYKRSISAKEKTC